MSSLSWCDGSDCCKSENDCEIYHIDRETEDFLKENVPYWMNGSYNDICKDCIDQTNIDYPDFFIIDESNNLSINKKYIDNPNLVK